MVRVRAIGVRDRFCVLGFRVMVSVWGFSAEFYVRAYCFVV